MNRHERRRAAAFGSRRQRETMPPDGMVLFWSVAARAMAESKVGQPGPFHQAFQDIVGAKRFVLTNRVTALAEDLRISDLGVTINSFEMGVPFPGRTWLEWDAAVEGRDPPLPHQVPYERVGVLIEADDTGQRGSIVVLAKTAPVDGQGSGIATMVPVAMTFDLRDDYERPESLIEPPSVEQIRRALASKQDPTTAELESSAVQAAAMERRFGYVEASYLADFLQESMEAGERRWHEADPDSFATAAGEVTHDATLALCAFMVVRTAGIRTSKVLRGTRLPTPAGGFDTAQLGYCVIDLAASDLSPVAGADPHRLHN